MIQLGIRLHDQEKLPIEELLPRVRERGFTCAHLALRKAMPDYPATDSALTPGFAHYLKNVFAKNNLDIALLGNYLNLLHPDEDVLKKNMESYYAHIRFASQLGCAMLGTETGAPNREYSFSPECRSDKTLLDFIRNLKPVVRCAEEFGVIIGIEPVAAHSVWCPKSARKVLDEIGSHNLQIIFDPVNLLDLDNLERRDEIFDEAIEILGKDIALVHLKDYIKVNEGTALKAVGAGTGEMDYTAIMRFLKKEKPFMYCTLENTTVDNAELCAAKMLEIYNSIE